MTSPVILNVGDRAMLTAFCFNGGGLSAAGVGDIVVANNSAHALVGFLPVCAAWKWGLERAVDPVSRVGGD